MSEYFPEPKSSGEIVEVELDLSNNAINSDIKNGRGADTLKFSKVVDLSNLKYNIDETDIYKLKNVPTNLKNLKSNVGKLDVDNLVPVPVDLSKLSDVVKDKVV